MTRAGKLAVGTGLLAVLGVATGCTSWEGPRFRYATQTPQALAALETEEVVWLEFREGDVVPLAVRVDGMVEGASEAPIGLVASRSFFLVYRRGQPMRLSVDGERVLDEYPGRGVLAFGVEEGEPQLGLLILLQDSPRTSGGEE